MATKKELEAELRKTKRELGGTLAKLSSAKVESEKRGEEIQRLSIVENQRNLKIERQSDMITSRNERIVRQETRINEMQNRLSKSWDEETARAVIDAFLENLPIQ